MQLSPQEHRQIVVSSMPASLPCEISQDVFNILTMSYTYSAVLVISKNLMLHDGDIHLLIALQCKC